ncbi:MAG: HAD-IIB family hydrolase, partial [Methylococcales bacterium]|nr:HAD-IIB family hydrolase [Methylococcales bacterium]
MSSTQYRVIAIDLDGTLLDDKGELSEKNLEALRILDKLGVKIILCSARAPVSIARFCKIIGLQNPLVAHNGCLLTQHDGITKIKSFYITEQIAKSFLNKIEPLNLLTTLYIDNNWYVNRLETSIVKRSSITRMRPNVVS